ncbi:related to VPS9 (involved in vacuole trafficking) [Cephalotrichum gorgonifer]|uniref:Related to VPS9 (Involved in vacuole trafficking) n=1 Tax=Cephalotrichum gorgonifer TaxID=2041049 RepID=A0AAE8SX07_9PEZI|nr:related to VPS9 (involved in vacuole trafficking) [Cephalotrichum gorgonifer]
MSRTDENSTSVEIPRSETPENLIDLAEPPTLTPQTAEPVVNAPEKASPEHDPPRDDPPDIMTSSVATIKPSPQQAVTSSPTSEGLLDVTYATTYVDPTPATPGPSKPPSRAASSASGYGHSRSTSEVSPSRSDAGYDDRRYLSEDEQEGGSRSEIQTIMAQFSGDGGGPDEDEVMSPRLEITSPHLNSSSQHPPRKSSLEPLAAGVLTQFQDLRIANESRVGRQPSKAPVSDDSGPPVPPKDAPPVPPPDRHLSLSSTEPPMSPSVTLHRPPPPEPEPEPALQFDFHRFLEQLRNKKADPVARYLKSFLQEFGKKQWMVHEQVKIVGDFLAFIANKMALCEVWRTVSDPEFDNAREGMEKLVMNRLYAQTFSPAIPPPQPVPGAKPKRRGAERPIAPGRRGQHQEDVERDEILTQKINIYGWIREEHLDIEPVSDSGKRFLKLAQQELLKIKSYRAPRDKIICVLNCCKVIFGLLKNAKSDTSADSFMPLLIYVVLQANPEHLVSNVQYILRFRNQDKLAGEAGYYLSSLMGAIQFIENMDRTTLTITDEEFEKNVEAAVSAIAEKHRPQSPATTSQAQFSEKPAAPDTLQPPGEPSARRSSESTPGDSSTPRRSTSSEGPDSEDQAAITGLLRTIQRPLTSIGRIFSDETPPSVPATTPRTAAATPVPARLSADLPPPPNQAIPEHRAVSAEEAAARQASAEAAEAQRLHRAEHANVVETLCGMFPDLDRDIISDVVYQKQGRVGLAVDACLALSS